MGRVTQATDPLAPLRARIDAIDARIVQALAERMGVVRDVVAVKERHGIPARLGDRVEAVVAHVRAEAAARDCPPDLAEQVWRTMIDWTIGYEERRMGAAGPEGTGTDG